MSNIKYTKEILIPIVIKSKSFAEVCRNLHILPATGSQSHLSKKIKEYNLDTSHFTGQNWSLSAKKIKNFRPIESYLIKDSHIGSSKLLKKLIKCGIKEKICENCKSITWLDKPINLELHHIDCNHFNNEISNLQTLCPNCHSYYHNKINEIKPKKIKIIISRFCPRCGQKIDKTASVCSDCYNHFRKDFTKSLQRKTKIQWPSKENLLKELETKSCLQLSKELGVSDNAIKKHLKNK